MAGTASLNQRTWSNPSHALTAGTKCTEETCRKEPSRVDPETGLGQVRGRQQDFTPVFHHSRWTTPDIELPANSPSPSQFTLWTRDPPANLRFPIRHVLASSLLYGEIGCCQHCRSALPCYSNAGWANTDTGLPAYYGPSNPFGQTAMPACFGSLAVGPRRPVSCRQETQDRSTSLHDRTDQRPTPRRNVRGRRAKGWTSYLITHRCS